MGQAHIRNALKRIVLVQAETAKRPSRERRKASYIVGLPPKVRRLLQPRYGSIPEGLGGQAWMPDHSPDAVPNEIPTSISRILMRDNIEFSCAAESDPQEPQRT
jgi:hypothetical protein